LIKQSGTIFFRSVKELSNSTNQIGLNQKSAFYIQDNYLFNENATIYFTLKDLFKN